MGQTWMRYIGDITSGVNLTESVLVIREMLTLFRVIQNL